MNRIWNNFQTLTAIDSSSFEERLFCDTLKEMLTELGIETYEDSAGAQIGGNCGNLYGYLPGRLPLEPLLFSAHMDTVEPGKSKKAVLDENGVITSAGDTVLGADDVAGIVIILEALTRLKESGQPHRPVELLFPVAEERYALGSALIDYARITARESYVLDLSGSIGEAANAAPTILAFEITITGKSAHAGFAPKNGIHAIAAAAQAITQAPLGEPQPGVMVNIGKITGGEANNIIPAHCLVSGEIRSLSHEAVLAQWQNIKGIFEQAAADTGASVTAQHSIHVTAYETPPDSPVVKRFQNACRRVNIPADIHSTLGGSDQNSFALHGISGIAVACSMHDVHSPLESSRLDELEQCVNLVLALITEDVP